jgi:hypothetical protein
MSIGVSFPKGKAAGVLSSPPTPSRVGDKKSAAVPTFTHTYLHVVHQDNCTFKESAVSATSIRKLRTAFTEYYLLYAVKTYKYIESAGTDFVPRVVLHVTSAVFVELQPKVECSKKLYTSEHEQS